MIGIHLGIAFILVCLSCTYQNHNSENLSTDKVFSQKELIEDLTLLKEVLTEVHPGIYWYNNPGRIDSIFNQAQRSLDGKQSEIEFYRKALELVSQINCGHTWLNASNPLSDSLWKNIESFPIEIKIINHRLYYLGDDIPNSIEKGNEIIAIDKRESGRLIKSMINYAIGDGFVQTGRVRMVERRFGFYYALLHGFDTTYEVNYSSGGEGENTATFSSKKATTKKQQRNETILFSNTEDQQTGLLKIATFSSEQVNQNGQFQSTISEIFKYLANTETENLILDLRDNRGGSDELGLLLLSHLVPDSITEFTKMHLKTIDSDLLMKYGDLGPELYEKLLKLTQQVNDTTFLLQDEVTLEPFPPSKPTFMGNLYVLINGNTFSTATDVCSILYSKGLATFIGEETGGGYYGNTSGLITQVTLPNTGFQLRLPLVRYETNVEDSLPKGSGVKPDFEFSSSKKSLLSSEDLMLEYTLNLIKEN